jgi:hypothetical protein
MSAWTAALDELQAAITEVQRLGTVLTNDVTGSLLGPFVAASDATTPEAQRASLDAMTAATAGIEPRAQQYVTDCQQALSGPLAAAYAAIEETPMTTRYVTLDFSADFGNNEPRVFVRDLLVGDTVIAQFVATPDDPKLRLGLTHTAPGSALQRRAILTDANGKVVIDHQASYYDWRMYTKSPPGRGYNIALEGGKEYTVTITQQPTGNPNQRADFFFTVNS